MKRHLPPSEESRVLSTVHRHFRRRAVTGIAVPALRLFIPATLLCILLLPTLELDAQTRKIRCFQSSQPVTSVPYAKRALQGYSMRVWLSNKLTMGMQAWDVSRSDQIPVEPRIGLEYPIGSGIEHLLGAGPVIAAFDQGHHLVSEAYNPVGELNEFIPNPGGTLRERIWRTSIGSQVTDSDGYSGYYAYHHLNVNRAGVDNDGDGKINEDDLDGMDNDGDWNPLTDDVGADGLPDSIESSCNGMPYDPVLNPDPAQDNFSPGDSDYCRARDGRGRLYLKNDKDYYTERNGIPDHGEPHVDEDYAALSDNDLYCSSTDTIAIGGYSNHIPLHVKIISKSYAWTSRSADGILPVEYSFVNLGHDTLRDVALGMMFDADVGPVSAPGFNNNNYLRYDAPTHTAIVENSVDRPSTDFGLSILGGPRDLDSTRILLHLFGAAWSCGPGTDDSVLYAWLSGTGISVVGPPPNQDSLYPTDIYNSLSIGTFGVFAPRDTLTMTIALLSGNTRQDVIRAAGRAARIWQHHGFVMPTAVIEDPGGPHPLSISWEGARSPYSDVNAYRLRWGPAPGVYTDSTLTSLTSAVIPRPSPGTKTWCQVKAFDISGRESGYSDEVVNILKPPTGLRITGEHSLIRLRWDSVAAPTLSGYRIYRKADSDSSYSLINPDPLVVPSYADSTARGNRLYWYRIAAVDKDGFESEPTREDSGHLTRPAPPVHFTVATGTNHMIVEWDTSHAPYYAGCNVYKRVSSLWGLFTRLNDTPIVSGSLADTTVEPGVLYDYYVESVDSNEATSPVLPITVTTVIRKQQILVVYDSQILQAYRTVLLAGYHSVVGVAYPELSMKKLSSQYAASSTILWFTEPSSPGIMSLLDYPLALRQYLHSGGHLLIMGSGLTRYAYPQIANFISETFGGASPPYASGEPEFIGAEGQRGFPTVNVNPLTSFAGVHFNAAHPIDNVELFGDIPPERVLYRYHGSGQVEGGTIGISNQPWPNPFVDTTAKALYFSFPVSQLDSSDARALIVAVLDYFGERTTGVTEEAGTPAEFRLYDAYPNPFNPSVRIQYSVGSMSAVTLKVYDVLGREVATLANERMPAGKYPVVWNAGALPAGVYFIRLTAGEYRQTGKVVLVR